MSLNLPLLLSFLLFSTKNLYLEDMGRDTEELSFLFRTPGQTVNKIVSPLKTGLIKRVCHRAERQWIKDKLEISLQILRDSWQYYQKTMKIKHFLDIIELNYQKPQFLLKTTDFLW